jgi:DNA replication protein DnaC
LGTLRTAAWRFRLGGSENIIAVGNRGTGKTHIALGLGLAACQKGLSVGFTTAAALVHELIEARDEKRLLSLQRQLAGSQYQMAACRSS